MVQVVSICLVILVVHHFGDRAGAAALSSSAALLAAFIASALGATRRLVVVADIVEILPEMPHLCVHPVAAVPWPLAEDIDATVCKSLFLYLCNDTVGARSFSCRLRMPGAQLSTLHFACHFCRSPGPAVEVLRRKMRGAL